MQGLGAPSSCEDLHGLVDAQTTEGFLFEFISQISAAVILVVNEYTWMEKKSAAPDDRCQTQFLL